MSAIREPTKEQDAAFRKLLGRGGRRLLTQNELYSLANHPYLTLGQRAEFAALAQELHHTKDKELCH